MCLSSYSVQKCFVSPSDQTLTSCADQSNIMDYSRDFSEEEVVSWLRVHGFSSETSERIGKQAN